MKYVLLKNVLTICVLFRCKTIITHTNVLVVFFIADVSLVPGLFYSFALNMSAEQADETLAIKNTGSYYCFSLEKHKN